jgi:catechol 2,3-dioxygenase-like lactoylglutathione lyase family enzyme
VFDHVTIRVSDRAASETFYETVLRVIGIHKTSADEWDDFSLAQATDENPTTQRLHLGFAASSRADVDEFWRTGIAAGFRSDGEPGPRPEYSAAYYGSFLLDPDGNSVEAVEHEGTADRTGIDHVWMRVADIRASRRFYDVVAPFGGYEMRTDTPERVSFRGANGTFSILPGAATLNLHLAFPASQNATVDAFHRAATDAGYHDNGAPGERPIYHAGYYAAFVLDPDGNNVEVVSHNRTESAAIDHRALVEL